MGARRARLLAGSIVAGLLTASLATPVAAADCTLTAPAYVNVGTAITIDGAGFPASTTIDLTLSVKGGATDEFTLQSDAAGALQLAFTPEDLDIGVTTLQARAGSACTAEVTYTVLAAGATPPPATPAPDRSSGPGAPPTDSDAVTAPAGGPGPALWALALALVGAGCLGLFLTRPAKRR